MLLDPTTLLALAPACAPQVAPSTLLAIARVESGLNPLVIGLNGTKPRRLSFQTPWAAAQAARALLAQGRDIDLGLAQINGRNLNPLGLSVAGAFDPCRNLAAAARLLKSDYTRAIASERKAQQALRIALSRYNTGDDLRGFRNGYVTRVEAAAQTVGPPPIAAPLPRSFEVFGHASSPAFVLTPSATSQGADR